MSLNDFLSLVNGLIYCLISLPKGETESQDEAFRLGMFYRTFYFRITHTNPKFRYMRSDATCWIFCVPVFEE